MDYVIIGNSAAAVGCVEGIRKGDPQGKITLVSDEPHFTYSRPLISYLLLGRTDEQRMKYRSEDFYEKNKVEALLGRRALSIDPNKKQVALDDGSALSYDKLLVATGSRPFIPPAKGMEQIERKVTFMSLDDAHALEAAIDSNSRVLIVGAGLIGLKCAEGIARRVGKITVVDLAARVLPSILDEEGAALVQRHIEEQGIEFILGDCVEEYTARSARLRSGRELDFDVVVIAAGVRPNTELISECGGEVERGICIDAHCQTTLPDVYAAGDCTLSYDITSGQERILALLPNAYLQGECAGICMAGGESRYDNAIPMNAIGFFGLHMMTAGSPAQVAYSETGDKVYKKLYVSDGLLKGFILIGKVERAGIYTALIRQQTPLDTLDFDLIAKNPQLMAFSRERRGQMLGGAL